MSYIKAIDVFGKSFGSIFYFWGINIVNKDIAGSVFFDAVINVGNFCLWCSPLYHPYSYLMSPCTNLSP